MTIKGYCENLPAMGINDLISKIQKDGFSKHEQIIIKCMDHLNKIIINHDATFIKAAKI